MLHAYAEIHLRVRPWRCRLAPMRPCAAISRLCTSERVMLCSVARSIKSMSCSYRSIIQVYPKLRATARAHHQFRCGDVLPRVVLRCRQCHFLNLVLFIRLRSGRLSLCLVPLVRLPPVESVAGLGTHAPYLAESLQPLHGRCDGTQPGISVRGPTDGTSVPL